ncbi:TerY-C metal binding domain-containing protein [Flavobacterium cerinum]|uniref:VWA domain-containing protein n=1 Tax=Flavobacterium cerinum TaxID=2502784 RepID=A0ABY5IPD1_9FLAO|nr:TerY-C metal binding domain-containing protein [Flavobacterium cerinum]UUC44698.1 VWA domain-containing protein [Flavobacterium cerinum]
MRRLPIYFLIDISESMVGEPIQQVEEGLSTIIQALKTDPYALETVWISIIVFAGQPKTLVPLQEIVSFYPPRFPIGSGTSLSKGLGHLMYELRSNVVKTTYEKKGDWKPIVFLFTDGVPTDDTSAAIREWKENWQKSANMIAISFGENTDTTVLGELTDTVLEFKNTNAQSYKDFFRWVSDSIKTSSISVENNGSGFELAKLDENTVSKIDLTKNENKGQAIDDNFVVLSAKCQNTKRPYLIKYARAINPSSFGGMDFHTKSYRFVGAFPVDNSYYELADASIDTKVNSEELTGAPSCPCCGNPYGLAVCSCQKVHCIDENEVSTCPWCNAQGRYGFGSGGFDITRAQG